jgi:antitoxin ParD1/3/4
MPTRNVNLTDHFDRFIEEGVTSGRYSNASEMVREGLRLLEEREEDRQAWLKWVREEAQKGIDAIERGEFVDVHSSEELRALLRGRRERVIREHYARQRND